jgi:hypothetical protein
VPSPICQVKDGGGAYQATSTGVNVTPGNTVTINLIDTSADSWLIECVYTDETSVAATVTASLTIDPVLRTATFTAPAAGKAYIFRSRVNNGTGPDGRTNNQYTTTFGVYTLAPTGRRVVASNETTESGPFGWLSPVNAAIRGFGQTSITKNDAADLTLAPAQYANAILYVTGTPGGAYNIVGPNIAQTFFVVINSTASACTIKKSGGAGITVAANRTAQAYHNGTDYIRLTADSVLT